MKKDYSLTVLKDFQVKNAVMIVEVLHKAPT